MYYDLPKSVEIDGTDFAIRYDFRVILDIIEALNDPELSDQEKAYVAIRYFYPDWENIRDYHTAVKECYRFINGGEDEPPHAKKNPRLVNWKMDAPRIIPAVNRVLGFETRGTEYDREKNEGGVHWYTFLGGYMEIGDCLFAQIVRIRDKLNKGKKLDKQEREWLKNNRHLVVQKQEYTEAEKQLMEMFSPKNNP